MMNSKKIFERLVQKSNKLIGLVGDCEDKVEQYYSKIFHSFAIDSHNLLFKDLESHFTSDKVSNFIKTMKEYELAGKEKLTELQLRVRQLLDQVDQISKEQNYQRVSAIIYYLEFFVSSISSKLLFFFVFFMNKTLECECLIRRNIIFT